MVIDLDTELNLMTGAGRFDTTSVMVLNMRRRLTYPIPPYFSADIGRSIGAVLFCCGSTTDQQCSRVNKKPQKLLSRFVSHFINRVWIGSSEASYTQRG